MYFPIYVFVDLSKEHQYVQMANVMLTVPKQIKFIEVSMNLILHYIFY